MNFIYISKITIIFLFLFISSCQEKIGIFQNSEEIIDKEKVNKFESEDNIDLNTFQVTENNRIDYYTNHIVNINFLNSKLKKIKINNFEGKIKNNIPLNVFFNDSYIYTINSKGEILLFDIEDGKIIKRISIDYGLENAEPISFSLVNNDFIIGLKSGEVTRIDKKGKIIWTYKKNKFLNTPIKFQDNYIIILYPEDLVILSLNGDIILEKKFKFGNTIQSEGGKIINYFNIIYFLLPNSYFSSIDTFLLDEHNSKLEDIQFETSLNNLDDNLYVYKNLFVYLDNDKSLYSYDLIKDKYYLYNFEIDKSLSKIFFNNLLINKNENNIEFYNLIDGKLLNKLKISNKISKKSKIIKAISINNKLHLFSNHGIILIFNNKLEFIDRIDLKVKKIIKVFNYQNKIFLSTKDGKTHIY